MVHDLWVDILIMKVVKIGDDEYIKTNSGEIQKLVNIQDFLGVRNQVDEFHKFNSTIQGESVSIIFEKYKRTHYINSEALKQIAMAITGERIEKGKTPNRDYITQRLSEYVNNVCRKKQQ